MVGVVVVDIVEVVIMVVTVIVLLVVVVMVMFIMVMVFGGVVDVVVSYRLWLHTLIVVAVVHGTGGGGLCYRYSFSDRRRYESCGHGHECLNDGGVIVVVKQGWEADWSTWNVSKNVSPLETYLHTVEEPGHRTSLK